MRSLHRLTSITFLAAWLLAACAQGETQATIQPSSPVPASPTAVQATGTSGSQPGCTIVSRQPTPDPTEEALIPAPGEDDWIKGSKDAQITLVEYSDFQ